jgi:hypothetical protein
MLLGPSPAPPGQLNLVAALDRPDPARQRACSAFVALVHSSIAYHLWEILPMLDAIDTSKFALHGTISIDALGLATAPARVGKEKVAGRLSCSTTFKSCKIW